MNENCKCKNRSGQETMKKAKNQEEMKWELIKVRKERKEKDKIKSEMKTKLQSTQGGETVM